METSRFEEAVKTAIPGADVYAKAEDMTLHITAVFEAKSYIDAFRRVHAALPSSDLAEEFIATKFIWFDSKRQWALAEAKKAVIAALEPVASRAHGMDHFIHVSADDTSLMIHIEELDGLSACQARERILPLSDSLLALVELKNISLRLPSTTSLFLMPAWDSIDDDDCDINPNWPSKTGNPSGGGRGNNPPKS